MEKARIESRLVAAMDHNQSLKTELGASIARYEASHFEKAKLEPRLQVILQQNQSLRTDLRATSSRHEASHSEEARLQLKLQRALEHVRVLKTYLKAVASRQGTSNLEQSQDMNNIASCSSQFPRSVSQGNPSSQTTTDFSDIYNMDAQLNKIMERVNHLEMLLSKKENTKIDRKNELVKYKTQENGEDCNGNSFTNGMELQLLPKEEGKESNLVIRTLEKQIDVQMQRTIADKNKDAAIIEKQACKIRVLTGLLQAKKPQPTEELQNGDVTECKRLKR